MDENTQIDAPLQSDQKEENKQEPSDLLTPEHPRFKKVIEKLHTKDEEIATLKQELEAVKTQVSQRQERTGDDDVTEEERAAIDKIGKQLKSTYVTKEELEQERRVNRRAFELDRLGEVYNGSNGYPKFEGKNVALYAQENGYGDNLEAAYFSMHRNAIIETEGKKWAKANQPGSSEQPTGGERQSPLGDVTPDQIEKMSDTDFDKLMLSFKKQATGR